MGARELPGDGVVDIPRVLDALAAQGADPVFAFEVFSREMAARGAEEMARWVHDSGGSSLQLMSIEPPSSINDAPVR